MRIDTRTSELVFTLDEVRDAARRCLRWGTREHGKGPVVLCQRFDAGDGLPVSILVAGIGFEEAPDPTPESRRLDELERRIERLEPPYGYDRATGITRVPPGFRSDA